MTKETEEEESTKPRQEQEPLVVATQEAIDGSLIATINLNERLLEAGLAWHYKSYDRNPEWARLKAGPQTKPA